MVLTTSYPRIPVSYQNSIVERNGYLQDGVYVFTYTITKHFALWIHSSRTLVLLPQSVDVGANDLCEEIGGPWVGHILVQLVDKALLLRVLDPVEEVGGVGVPRVPRPSFVLHPRLGPPPRAHPDGVGHAFDGARELGSRRPARVVVLPHVRALVVQNPRDLKRQVTREPSHIGRREVDLVVGSVRDARHVVHKERDARDVLRGAQRKLALDVIRGVHQHLLHRRVPELIVEPLPSGSA